MSNRMQANVIIAVLKRWIEVLARLVLAWREHRRSQRTLMISEENGALLVHRSGEDAAGRKAQPKPKVLSSATARRVARSARGRPSGRSYRRAPPAHRRTADRKRAHHAVVTNDGRPPG